MEKTSPKPFAFILMPFSEEFTDVYNLGIKQACKDVDVYAERLDEQIFKESMLNRIYNQISKADLIIADMTSRNPNVFYEVGYAHALNKTVILLTQKEEDIPFDLKHYPHIIYDNITNLKTELKKRVKYFVKNPEHFIKNEFNTILYINGIELINTPTIEFPIRKTRRRLVLYNVNLYLDINNNSENYGEISEIKIGIIASEKIDDLKTDMKFPYHNIKLSSDQNLYISEENIKLYPGDWSTLQFNFSYKDQSSLPEEDNFTFRIFSEIGFKDYDFRLKFILDET